MKINYTFLILIFLFSACYKYEPQFSGPYSDEENDFVDIGESPIFEVAYIKEGPVFLLDPYTGYFEQVPNLPFAERVAINYNHDKLAVKGFGDIQVFDLEGTLIESIPNTSDVSWFDWHANDETLYMLDGSNLRFHGPEIATDIINFTNDLPFYFNSFEVFSVAVTPVGDVIYTCTYNTSFGPIRQARINYYDGTSSTNKDFTLELLGEITNLRLDENGETAVFNTYSYLGSGESGTYQLDIATAVGTFLFDNSAVAAISPDGQEIIYEFDWNLKLFSTAQDFMVNNNYDFIEQIDW